MRVAAFLPNWIGDVVMATPALSALRERYPDAEFVAVCKPYVTGVLDGAPWFDRVVALDRTGPWAQRWWGAAKRLGRPDVAVLFANTFRSGLTAFAARSRRTVGFVRYGRGWLLHDKLEPKRDAHGRLVPTPILDDYNRLAVAAGTADPGRRMRLFTTPSDEAAADAALASVGFRSERETICLNPGAAFGSSKHWPEAHFASVARDLADRRGTQVLVLCGPSERDLARSIVRLADRDRVRSIADRPLSLGLTKALVKRCALVATTDSGPRHFAAAFDRPVVTLFGPTFIAWTETYFARAIHLHKPVPCGPCQQRVCTTDHACMTGLTPAEVIEAIDTLLAGRQPLVRVAS